MSNVSESTFSFSPRPEAHAMDWEELLPPVKRAVRDLLLRIEGATQKELKKGGVAANCFLIYGDRGTGKTTVLLSAKHACNFTEKFFSTNKDNNSGDDVRLRADANKSAERLKNVVWLDVLDLEPLPPGANLLTTMLTRVRNALYPSDTEESLDRTTSILEERTDSARQRLKKLINDATLMWEDIHEEDTRSRANRQVAAADIYAQFQKSFKEAIDTLSKELGHRSGIGEKYRPIVLPIDNIDRSTEHLYSMVKLAQMVFCPRLWLVMAGDREDVDTFLERAYWKELIRVGEGAGATGKTGVSGEDEALVMARRQAAAALHRLLPPSHRIEVQLMEPEETLAFKLSPTFGSELLGYDQKISDLLKKILITEKEAEQQSETSWPKITLNELFDTQERVEKIVGETNKPCLTEAAELGLRLPARQVLDLWQLAYWITNDPNIPGNDKAEKIARTMLRNAITESSMSNEMGRRLQQEIIRRNPRGGTMLNFWDPAHRDESLLNMFRLTLPDFQLRPDAASFALTVYHCKPMMLTLRPPQKGDGDEKNLDGNGMDVAGNGNIGESLPDLVAAWLSVLYDVVVWRSEVTMVANRPDLSPHTQICCSHWGIENVSNYWQAPQWQNFLEHDLYGQLWQQHFLSQLRGKKWLYQAGHEDSLLRLLATGYVACVLETFYAFMPSEKEKTANGILSSLNGVTSPNEAPAPIAIKTAEMKVMNAAADAYKEILDKRGSIYRVDEVTRPMRDWLETQLPLLLSYWVVPMAAADVAKTRAEEIMECLEGTNLAKYWKANLDLFEDFDDLHQLWSDSQSAGG